MRGAILPLTQQSPWSDAQLKKSTGTPLPHLILLYITEVTVVSLVPWTLYPTECSPSCQESKPSRPARSLLTEPT